MGPMKNLSALLNEVRSQAIEVTGFVHRMRDANRHLTGGTGETPQKDIGRGGPLSPEPPMPLLADLTAAVEDLNGATSALRAEINYFEQMVSETAPPATSPATARY